MSRRKSVIGIALLCALALSAVVASSASAAAGRAFECAEEAGGPFFGPHCLTAGDKTNPTSKFVHREIKNGVASALTGTNANSASETTASSPATLAGTLAGVKIAIVCTGVSGTGSLTNAATGVSGTGQITYTGCTVEQPIAGCEVPGGTIKTSTLSATTVGFAINNELEFKAPTGMNFATIPIQGCKNEVVPTNSYPVTGSFIATTRGATIETVEATITAQKTLRFGGQVASISGAITISKSGGNPLILT